MAGRREGGKEKASFSGTWGVPVPYYRLWLVGWLVPGVELVIGYPTIASTTPSVIPYLVWEQLSPSLQASTLEPGAIMEKERSKGLSLRKKRGKDGKSTKPIIGPPR